MRCEICGKPIKGAPARVIVDGAKLTVCERCRIHGSGTWSLEETRSTPQPPPILRKKAPRISIPENVDVVEDFGRRVREARESLGLSLEELSSKVGEKVSVLRKIEANKLKPDIKLAKKLEHALKITLLREPTEAVAEISSGGVELTLGDVVEVKRRKAV